MLEAVTEVVWTDVRVKLLPDVTSMLLAVIEAYITGFKYILGASRVTLLFADRAMLEAVTEVVWTDVRAKLLPEVTAMLLAVMEA